MIIKKTPARLLAALDRHSHKIEEWYIEDGSYWINLRNEWFSPEMECGTIHESNSAKAVKKLANAIKKDTLEH